MTKWDAVADVVVVGFGGAGACAAIEAADAGAEVLVLDRFGGGGATAISGGVVYAGGGTRQQRQADVHDTPQAVYDYLRLETEGAVSDRTLRRFCDQSAAMLSWLEELGVPFEGSLAPFKTSYPTNDYYLYYSGNELAGPSLAVAPPAPRGHRARGRSTSGKALYGPLRAAVEARPVVTRRQTRAEELVLGDDGTVLGVRCSTIAGAPARVVREHRWLSRHVGKLNLWYRPLGKRMSRRLWGLERRYGRTWTVRARRGVVLAAGGFAFNREMVRQNLPAYAAGLPLGTLGDDGSGILMGKAAGGATANMDRASAWRFFTPPSALAKGLLLGLDGSRVCNEALYGAAVAESVIHDHGGRAYLVVDQPLLAEARKQVRRETLWFQRLQVMSMLGSGRVVGETLADAVAKVGIDAERAEESLAAYNDMARAGGPDPLGKPSEQLRPLERGPFSLVDVSVRSSLRVPCPTMTLGGLAVDEDTGQVLDEKGRGVPGLYAAGRTASGMCSRSYVSGLSIADCVFSGRRAGRAVAASAGGPAPADDDLASRPKESA